MSRTILLLARAAIAAPALDDMAALAAAVSKAHGGAEVDFAFTEQGRPNLRERLTALASRAEVVLVPLMFPAEPGYINSLSTMVDRWRLRQKGPLPRILLAPGPTSDAASLAAVVAALPARAEVDLTVRQKLPPDASLIPEAPRRVLVCMGGPCSEAGSAGLWQQLRDRQDRDRLRSDHGMMSCRTSCLGPCSLAPVVQVWPEGRYYCGLDEEALDRIVDEDIMGGTAVAALLYTPSGRKQRLR